MPKTYSEKVLSKVGKRPQSSEQIAAKLGVPRQAVARVLGTLHAQGKIVKTQKGYQQA